MFPSHATPTETGKPTCRQGRLAKAVIALGVLGSALPGTVLLTGRKAGNTSQHKTDKSGEQMWKVGCVERKDSYENGSVSAVYASTAFSAAQRGKGGR
jgi:hypothetical protein